MRPNHSQRYFGFSILVSSIVLLASFPNLTGGITTTDSSITAYYLQLYNAINSYRARHTIQALRWNRTMTATAEDFASRVVALSKSDSFDSENWSGCNFYIASGTPRPTASKVTSTWYNESALYDFRNPGYNPVYNNFTQMIWKTSTSVGLGVYSDGNVTAIVAKYYPVGNVRGKFRQNVVAIYKKM